MSKRRIYNERFLESQLWEVPHFAKIHLTVLTAILGAIFSLISISLSEKSCRSSVAMMDSTGVPKTCTPYFCRTPLWKSSTPDTMDRKEHNAPSIEPFSVGEFGKVWCWMLTAVESRLSSHGEQDAVGALYFDHLLYKLRSDGKEVHRVCLLGANLVSLYRGNVGVNQHSL